MFFAFNSFDFWISCHFVTKRNILSTFQDAIYLLKQLSFSKNFFTFVSIMSHSFKIIYLFCLNLKNRFCCQSCDIVFLPKTVKIEKQKTWDFLEYTEFYHPAKFELKRRKNGKVISRMHILHPICPQWKLSNLTLLIRAIPTLWIEPLLLSFFNQHVGWDMISHKSSSPTFSTRVTTMYSSCVM